MRKTPFLDIGDLVGSPGPEQGLFSLSFHPHYAKNHRLYVAYTDNRGDIRVAEYRSDGVRAVRRLRQLLVVRQRSGSLASFGRPHYEGLVTRDPTPLNQRGVIVPPVLVHRHRDGDPREACLITGGYVYRGSAVPAVRGRYVYGDA